MPVWARLNPRFDGAFLNWYLLNPKPRKKSLNPRFDGAFLNLHGHSYVVEVFCLNPRFDGAFLNSVDLALAGADSAS